MRSSARVWLGVLAAGGALHACSFIDDFDKFHAAREVGQSGDSGAARSDASVPADANVRTDAAGATDGASELANDAAGPGEVDANVRADAAIVLVDAGSVGPGVCGDGVIDRARGETCDDQNTVSGDGCEPGTCTATPSPTCAGKVCADNDPCTVDGCDAVSAACTYAAIDADRDGFSPGVCSVGSVHKGGDCNDGNAMIGPTAVEICDGLDNNCDSRREIDEGLVKLRCYPDLDGDGYPNLDGMGVLACSCAAGQIAVAAPEDRSNHDCWDDPVTRGADVFPGQTDFFEEGYGPGGRPARSFDYNCDGVVTPRLGPLPDTCGGLLGLDCKAKVGYSREVPSCGEGAEYTTCGMNGLNCSGMTETRKQSCR